MSTLMGAVTAPVIGGALGTWLSWRDDLLLLAVTGATIVLFTLWLLPAQPVRGQHVGLGEVVMIARTPAMFGALLLGLVQYYGLYTCYALMPGLLSERLALNTGEIGLLLACIAVGVFAGSWVGGHSADRRGLRFTLLLGAFGVAAAAGLLAVLSNRATAATPPGVFGAALLFLGLTCGFGFPGQLHIMVDYFPALRGTAAGLQFFARFVGTTTAPAVAGWLADGRNLSAGFTFSAIFVTLSVVVAFFTIVNPSHVHVPALELDAVELQ